MNVNELKAELVRQGVSLRTLATILGIDRSTLYKKMSGRTQFLQSEIAKIGEILHLDSNKIVAIFFDNKVS